MMKKKNRERRITPRKGNIIGMTIQTIFWMLDSYIAIMIIILVDVAVVVVIVIIMIIIIIIVIMIIVISLLL